MRITCDANVLVRAAVRPAGPARAALEQFLQPPHVLVLSQWILDEVRRVLSYHRLQKQARLTAEQIEVFVSMLSQASDTVVLEEPVPKLTNDADDDFVLATAVQGKADVLCSRDRHLRHADVSAYCEMHSLRVLTDTEFLTQMRAEGEEESEPIAGPSE
jgi:hypothetical protein